MSLSLDRAYGDLNSSLAAGQGPAEHPHKAVARPARTQAARQLINFLSNLSISQKLLIAFGATFFCVVLMCGSVVICQQEAFHTARLLAKSDTVVDDVDRAMAGLFDQNASIRGHILYRLPRYLDKYADAGQLVETALADAREKAANNPKILDEIEEIIRSARQWQEEIGDPAVALGENESTFQKAAEITTSEHASVLINRFRVAAATVRTEVNAWSEEAENKQYFIVSILLVVLIFGTLISLMIMAIAWYWLTHSTGVPMIALTASMKRLAAGDIDVPLPALERNDEVGQIAKAAQFMAQQEQCRRLGAAEEVAQIQNRVVNEVAAVLEQLSKGNLVARLDEPFTQAYEKLRFDYNAAIDKLQDAMELVLTNTSAIQATSAEISVGAVDLAHRTEEQACHLEKTTIAITEFTDLIRGTVRNVADARDIACCTNSEALTGGEVVQSAILAMGKIRQTAESIVQITTTLDHVATQTNLLALNATVEAARAGQAGRGFSVVANEIRALAKFSAEAAKNIKQLIEQCWNGIEQGSVLVLKSGQTFGRIAERIAEIEAAVGQIASSTSEQATILAQINNAMTEIEAVTQQNATMVEQTTAATQTLACDADVLAKLVARFRVKATLSLPTCARATPKSFTAGMPLTKISSANQGTWEAF